MTATNSQTETLLLGPGPSNVPLAVREALARPLLGHLDHRFLAIFERCKELLRTVFGTRNRVTFPVSGTGSAGMECCLINAIEPGDRVVVGVNGVFGGRIARLAEAIGATVVRVEAPWGEAVPFADLRAAVEAADTDLIAVVHAETSTGVLQPLDGLGALARAHDALLLIDCVTSLGGVPVRLDDWQVDIAYSGTQKCLNCPPGLAPVSFSERAIERFRRRSCPVPSFYFDLDAVLAYVDGDGGRSYHHTAPVGLIVGLVQALELVVQEGVAARHQRHVQAGDHLLAGLGQFGLEPLVPAAWRLVPLTTVRVPGGIDEATIRRRLLEDHDIEIGGGLGPLAGAVWRIGLMGINAEVEIVDRLLEVLQGALPN